MDSKRLTDNETPKCPKCGVTLATMCDGSPLGCGNESCVHVAPAPTASAREWRKSKYSLEVLSTVGATIFAISADKLDELLEAYASSQSEKDAAEIERLSKERDDLVRLIKASPNLDRKWGEEDLYACVNICLNALFWRKEEVERLSRTIEIQRKIRAYVAFVLAGDELADVQMAADKTMEKLEAAESKLSQLQDQGGKLCCWVGAAMMLSHDVQAAVQKLPANFDMPHSLKVALAKIQEMATDKFGKNVVSANNEEKAKKIAVAFVSHISDQSLAKKVEAGILAILNGGQQ